MENIEQAAREIVSQMWPHTPLNNVGMQQLIEMTKQHLTTLTKPLEDEIQALTEENKMVRDVLKKSSSDSEKELRDELRDENTRLVKENKLLSACGKDEVYKVFKALEDENERLQKALEVADELNLANQQLTDEVKRLKEHIAETAGLLRNAADNVQESEIENKRFREALREAMSVIKREFGDYNWRVEAIKKALTKPT